MSGHRSAISRGPLLLPSSDLLSMLLIPWTEHKIGFLEEYSYNTTLSIY
jgi:hypothetical protein